MIGLAVINVISRGDTAFKYLHLEDQTTKKQKHPHTSTWISNVKQIINLGIIIAIGLVISLMPVPEGLERES